jgi:N-acetylglucosamine kinase-like BadF-type ATPase
VRRYFLGVDGGQSATVAVLGDGDGQFLGLGSGGPCNHVKAAGGRQKFIAAIRESVSAACRAAGLDPGAIEFEAACLGFSGGPEDKREILEQMLRARHLVVTTDAWIALSGATAGGAGIITIAGTGSIAYGRNGAGQTARAGGWGFIFGDEGGAFDIVRQALRAALRFEEGWGPPTALRQALLSRTRAGSANDLLHRFYTRGYPRARIAGYAKLVDQVAAEGDPVAVEILHGAAQQLATLAAAVRRQLFRPGEAALVCYIGGVFESRRVLERFRTLVELEGGSRCLPPRYPPEAGALLEAYRAAGLAVELRSFPS